MPTCARSAPASGTTGATACSPSSTCALAGHGLNILAGRIATSRDDVALDAFRISDDEQDAGADSERWERVERTLRRVLAGEVDVEELVRRSRRPSILARPKRRVPTVVE